MREFFCCEVCDALVLAQGRSSNLGTGAPAAKDTASFNVLRGALALRKTSSLWDTRKSTDTGRRGGSALSCDFFLFTCCFF